MIPYEETALSVTISASHPMNAFAHEGNLEAITELANLQPSKKAAFPASRPVSHQIPYTNETAGIGMSLPHTSTPQVFTSLSLPASPVPSKIGGHPEVFIF
ncbi:hypothetical protein CDAR_26931 [Caerostris darwini]|uniref:Uncharacterized protein n=1 Tax=Caerostris darwini TaxID=1538125 RepID=A0AAV4TIF4_9ARAC|nr:hypothetical protein CDAR_26931 [Caerostris darwini]